MRFTQFSPAFLALALFSRPADAGFARTDIDPGAEVRQLYDKTMDDFKDLETARNFLLQRAACFGDGGKMKQLLDSSYKDLNLDYKVTERVFDHTKDTVPRILQDSVPTYDSMKCEEVAQKVRCQFLDIADAYKYAANDSYLTVQDLQKLKNQFAPQFDALQIRTDASCSDVPTAAKLYKSAYDVLSKDIDGQRKSYQARERETRNYIMSSKLTSRQDYCSSIMVSSYKPSGSLGGEPVQGEGHACGILPGLKPLDNPSDTQAACTRGFQRLCNPTKGCGEARGLARCND